MPCNFTISFNEAIETLIEKAKNGIVSNGGTFKGNTKLGEYSIPVPTGTIKGKYTVSGKEIVFDITEKPFIPTCSRIEKELRNYLATNATERLTFD